MNVGVIGLGMMGSSIATRLDMKGHKTKAEKLNATRTEKLTIADQPKEVGDTSDMT